MPFFSGVGNTNYPANDDFRPVTVLTENAVPTYGLFFDVRSSYDGSVFAFDNCADFAQLLSDKVDVNFLTSRYERLFRLPGSSLFYLVPWMAVRCTKSSSGNHVFDDNLFFLDVKAVPPYRKVLPISSPPDPVNLKLVPSHASIRPIWSSAPDPTNPDTLFNVNIGAFTPSAIQLIVDDAVYDDAGAYVDIRDLTAKKTVGRVRLVFVEKLVQKVFVFKLSVPPSAAAQTYHLERLPRAGADDGIPKSLERSHGKIVADANTFGFQQIGVTLEMAGNDVDLYRKDGTVLMGPVGNGRAPYVVFGAGDLSVWELYVAWLEKFLTEVVAYAKRTSGGTLSKFSYVYVFVTPFDFAGDKDNENVAGVSVHGPFTLRAGATAATIDLAKRVPANVSLFETIRNGAGAAKFADRYHCYDTLVHEVAHALLVSHYFEIVPPALAVTGYRDLYDATQWLRLYLPGPGSPSTLITDIAAVYDVQKIEIGELKTTHPGAPMWTLFDDMVAAGFGPAVTAFVASRMFPGGTPPFWGSKADDAMPMADLIIWRSLNDLIRFMIYATKNVMDYVRGVKLETDPATGHAFLEPRLMRFSRHQWELIRKTVAHLRLGTTP
jgi:hypothetical protein